MPRDLSSRRKNDSFRRHNSDFVELGIKTATGTLWVPHATESTGKEKSGCAVWVIGVDHRGEIGLLLHNRGKEEYACNIGDPLENLLVLSCPMIEDNEKLQ